MPAVRARSLGFAFPLLAALGCSLAFHPEDFYGPTGADGGGATDALLDAHAKRESGQPQEAGRDGASKDVEGPDSEAGNATFCTGVDAAFCSDFDEGVLGLGWSAAIAASTLGTLALDDGVWQSKPASLHSSLPKLTVDAGPDNEEFLQEDLATPWREVTLDFDFYAEQPSGGQGLTLVELTFQGDASLGVAIELSGSTTELRLVCMQTVSYMSWKYATYPFTPNKWIHAQFDIVPSTTHGSATMTFDEALYASWTNLQFDADPKANDLRLELGLAQYGAYTPADDVHFDNVVIRYP
jgi:hypothetical protein